MIINLEDIQKTKKNNFLNIVKNKIQLKTLLDLNKIKQSQSKVNHLKYVVSMKQYLMPNNLKIVTAQPQTQLQPELG